LPRNVAVKQSKNANSLLLPTLATLKELLTVDTVWLITVTDRNGMHQTMTGSGRGFDVVRRASDSNKSDGN